MEWEAHVDESTRLGRREFLVAGLGTGAGLAAAAGPINYSAIARNRRLPFASDGRFPQGVASGAPFPYGITLWTRVAGLDRTSRVRVVVSTDRQFRRIVKRFTVKARRDRNYAAKAFVRGLRPDTEYYYRFCTKERCSQIGRFRTAPHPSSNRPVRIAFYSCQSYEAGYYNAQRALAEEDDIDLVLCLGDYIYETSFYPGPDDRVDRTGPNGDGLVQTKQDYWEKYRFYKSDPNLKAMHQAHPFVAIWDDHEVEDNYAGQQPDATQNDPSMTNHGEPRTVPFQTRRLAGYKAFFDMMPRFAPPGDPRRIFDSYRMGRQVEFFTLDQRQYRDRQPCGGELLAPCPEEDDPGRKMLGDRQKAWLKDSLTDSFRNWKLLLSQVMFMGLETAPTVTVNVDGWDGYGAERAEILQHAIDHNVENLTALTGDIHTFFAGRMTTTGNDSGATAGVELVGGSATSHGIAELFMNPPEPNTLAQILRANNPHLDYVEATKRGYAILEAGPSELTCEFKSVDALSPNAPAHSLQKFRVASGSTDVELV